MLPFEQIIGFGHPTLRNKRNSTTSSNYIRVHPDDAGSLRVDEREREGRARGGNVIEMHERARDGGPGRANGLLDLATSERHSPAPGQTRAGARLAVTPVRSLADLDALAPAWDALLGRSRADSVFLTFDWVRTWVEHFVRASRSLLVLRIADGADLVGIAPFCVRQVGPAPLGVRRLEFLGLPETGSDYLDAIAEVGREGEVAAALYGALFGDLAGQWDEMSLEDVPLHSPVLTHLLALASRDRRFVKLVPGSICPQIMLPRDPVALPMAVAPKRQKVAARDWRRLERRGSVAHLVGDGSSRDAALGPILELYTRVWGTRLPPGVPSFLRDLTARWGGTGRIQADLLTLGGRPLAGLLHLRHGRALLMYLHVVDRSATGNVTAGDLLVQRAVERAVREGLAVYDFLKGAEPYKFRWANGVVQSLNVRMYRKSAAGVALALTGLARDMARILLR